MQGNHRATKERKNRKRWLGVPITVWMLVLLSTVALAAWLVFFAFSGVVTSGAFDVYTATGTSCVASEGSCTANLVGGEVQITWDAMTPGATLTVTQKFAGNAANDSSAKIQSFALSHDGASGDELTAALGGQCGAEIVGAAELDVDVVITLEDTSEPGTVYTIDNLSGYTWVPSGAYDAGSCT